jgi:hypothetical protein
MFTGQLKNRISCEAVLFVNPKELPAGLGVFTAAFLM